MTAKGNNYPILANLHVERMNYAADVNLSGPLEVDLSPRFPIATAGVISDLVDVSATDTIRLDMSGQTEAVMGKFGRGISLTASGAATAVVVVRGFDYLNQPVTENITLAGAVAVSGKKAFRRVESVTPVAGTAATTVNIATTNVLGIPYRMIDIGILFADGIKGAAYTGVVGLSPAVAGSATSVDPRGVITPAAAQNPNGVRNLKVTYYPDREDLMGPKHFSS